MNPHQLEIGMAGLFPFMHDAGFRVHHNAAKLANSAAEVGIFGVHKVAIVEAPDLLENFRTHKQETALNEFAIEILRLVDIFHGVVIDSFLQQI